MTTASEGIDEENGCVIPNRIFVGSMSYSTTEGELKGFFQRFGAVRDSKIITDRKGISKGYGFITFECQEDASRAQEQGEVYLREKKLNIGPAIRKQPGGQFHKPTSTSTTTPTRSVDRSSDGDSFESPQSSAVSSPQSSAEVAPTNHVDLTHFSHETATPVYAAPSALTHCSCNALLPGFVAVATTQTNACCYQCHSLQVANAFPQLVYYYPPPTEHVWQCQHHQVPMIQSQSPISMVNVSPIEPDNPVGVHSITTAGPRVEIVSTTTTTNVTGSGRRYSESQ